MRKEIFRPRTALNKVDKITIAGVTTTGIIGEGVATFSFTNNEPILGIVNGVTGLACFIAAGLLYLYKSYGGSGSIPSKF